MIDTQLPKNIQNDNFKINYEYHDFVECITSALDARDPYTSKHSERVSDMACFISKECIRGYEGKCKGTARG